MDQTWKKTVNPWLAVRPSCTQRICSVVCLFVMCTVVGCFGHWVFLYLLFVVYMLLYVDAISVRCAVFFCFVWVALWFGGSCAVRGMHGEGHAR